MSQKRTSSILGGILMTLSAICYVVFWNDIHIRNDIYIFNDTQILTIVGVALIAISMFLPRRQLLPICGFLISALPSTLETLVYLQRDRYDEYTQRELLISLAWIIGLMIVISSLTDKLQKIKKLSGKLWFLPPILLFLGIYLSYNNFWNFDFDRIYRFNRYYQLLLVAGLAVTLYSVTPIRMKKNYAAQSQAESEMYCSLAKHVLLLLFTCGIWEFIWIYRTTKHTNISTHRQDGAYERDRLRFCHDLSDSGDLRADHSADPDAGQAEYIRYRQSSRSHRTDCKSDRHRCGGGA